MAPAVSDRSIVLRAGRNNNRIHPYPCVSNRSKMRFSVSLSPSLPIAARIFFTMPGRSPCPTDSVCACRVDCSVLGPYQRDFVEAKETGTLQRWRRDVLDRQHPRAIVLNDLLHVASIDVFSSIKPSFSTITVAGCVLMPVVPEKISMSVS